MLGQKHTSNIIGVIKSTGWKFDYYLQDSHKKGRVKLENDGYASWIRYTDYWIVK